MLPLRMQIKMARWAWSVSLLGNHRVQTQISQKITYQEDSPVTVYPDIESITKATSVLKWTSDPRNGKVDAIKHPTFMQQAINSHPDYSGDCDDFATYWAAALIKGHLVKLSDVFICSSTWSPDNKTLTGHCCCVFFKDQKWFWVSNWNKCIPIEIPNSNGFIQGIQRSVGFEVLISGQYSIESLGRDDMIYLGKARKL